MHHGPDNTPPDSGVKPPGCFLIFMAVFAVAVVVALYVAYQERETIGDHLQAAWSGASADKLRLDRLRAAESKEAFDEMSRTPTEAQRKQAEGIRRLLRGE